MRRRLLFFTIAILIYVLHSYVWAQKTDQPGISISGTLMTLDGVEPHTAVPVQAICNGKVVATTLSNADGKYQLASLKPGEYHVRCQVLSGYVYYGQKKARGSGEGVILDIEVGKDHKGIDFLLPPFKKGTWKTYTALDGLAHKRILSIYGSSDGALWFGTYGGGISRYNGQEFTNLTTRDGLVQIDVWDICQDSSGIMWFGTAIGISRYDGRKFLPTDFIKEDALINGLVPQIYCDNNGIMWFGTQENGVFRYDGKKLINFTVKDGLVDNHIMEICQDQNGAMWFATANGVCSYNGSEFVAFTTEDGLIRNFVNAVHCDPNGIMWFGTSGGVSRYDGETFVNLKIGDGLAHRNVKVIQSDLDGVMWFGTGNSGVSRYDGETFVNFTTEDGLADGDVHDIYCDPDGVVWFGTWSGVSRYDGKAIANFGGADGYVSLGINNFHASGVLRGVHRTSNDTLWFAMNWGDFYEYDGRKFVRVTLEEDPSAYRALWKIFRNSDEDMWFSDWGHGIYKYDGETFTNFDTENSGLPNDRIWSMYRAADGGMWFGTWGSGASRYDGKTFNNLSSKDGLLEDHAYCFYQDPDGLMWIGTRHGISRYDGEQFISSFTTEDGLTDNDLCFIQRAPDGMLWIGTQYGLCRYDGERFIRFSEDEELVWFDTRSMYCSTDGIMWFGTYGHGVLLYDGEVWTSLDTQDGLVSDQIWPIHQDSNGDMWFDGHKEGLMRYRRSKHPPRAYIISITAKKRYEDISSIPAFTHGTRVTIEYDAIDFKTRPEKRQYRCRIKEIDADWRKPIKSDTFDFAFDEPGTYTFQVQAIDRDLNYSEPASLELKIVSPLYLRAVFLIPTVGSGTVLLVTLIILATALTRRRRQIHAYERMAVQELQDAREMQLSLLPEAAPVIEGMEIAGRSITANTVGGDFYDYISLPDGRIGIAIADVSGKGLRAAMNATMTSGMMHEVATIESSCGSILSRLNSHLYPLMERHMFTAFSFAILDPDEGAIHWSSAAQPLPIVIQSDGASEADGDSELPLGMMPDVKYSEYGLKLQTGDIVIFYTDGIIEAENESEEMYGIDRLINLASGIATLSSPEDVIEIILKDVSNFVGSTEQYDDMTIVVIGKTGE